MKLAFHTENLSDKDVSTFGSWAFGDGWLADSMSQLDVRWNDLHKDLFDVNWADGMYLTTIKMIRKWKELGKPA